MPDLFVTEDQIVVGMRVAETLVLNANRQRNRNKLATFLNADLAVGELLHQCLDGVLRPGASDVVVYPIHKLLKLIVVIKPQVSEVEVQFFMGHSVRLPFVME